MSKREKGIEMFNEVYCNDLPQPPEKGEDGFFDFMLESLFSELWGNDILTIEQRRLLLLGAIASQGEEMTFTIQARSAMKRGELSFAQEVKHASGRPRQARSSDGELAACKQRVELVAAARGAMGAALVLARRPAAARARALRPEC